jgi:hypothetical protein
MRSGQAGKRFEEGIMMRCLKRRPGERGPGDVRRTRILAGLLVMSATSPLAAQDDYLRALESEATKIAPAEEVSAEPAARPAAVTQAPAEATGVTREQFESLLQDKYRGTFVFYRQLQPHTQEEIFSEFEGGVPIAELRDKIVVRYLQR